jgi:hypothetical protein
MQIDLRSLKTICISLSTAIERRKKIEKLLTELNYTDWSFFDAVKGKDIAEGCAKSHMEVLSNHDFKSPLLLVEDDINTTRFYSDTVEIDEKIDALYLGYSAWAWEKKRASMSTFPHNTKVYKKNNLYKIERMLSTHAILYLNKEYAERAIFAMKDHLDDPNSNRHCDVALGNLQEYSDVFATPHPFFYQDCKHNAVYTYCSIDLTLQEIEKHKENGLIVRDLS